MERRSLWVLWRMRWLGGVPVEAWACMKSRNEHCSTNLIKNATHTHTHTHEGGGGGATRLHTRTSSTVYSQPAAALRPFLS
jgi:hypothetical protein